jgi:hypothetical protein
MTEPPAICPECGRDRSNREPHKPTCSRKPTVLTSVTDEGEVLVTMPNGRMVFMGFWDATKFVCRAVFSGHRVAVEK